jgi:hypothetical protein
MQLPCGRIGRPLYAAARVHARVLPGSNQRNRRPTAGKWQVPREVGRYARPNARLTAHVSSPGLGRPSTGETLGRKGKEQEGGTR